MIHYLFGVVLGMDRSRRMGIRKVVFGGQVMDEEVVSLNKRSDLLLPASTFPILLRILFSGL